MGNLFGGGGRIFNQMAESEGCVCTGRGIREGSSVAKVSASCLALVDPEELMVLEASVFSPIPSLSIQHTLDFGTENEIRGPGFQEAHTTKESFP